MTELLADLITILENSRICTNSRILETTVFSIRQFAFKIRTAIYSTFTLQLRIYFNDGHYDYSYQVFDKKPLCRWDNKEHFPELMSFPHHFHAPDGKIIESSLKGDPRADVGIVLAELEELLPDVGA